MRIFLELARVLDFTDIDGKDFSQRKESPKSESCFTFREKQQVRVRACASKKFVVNLKLEALRTVGNFNPGNSNSS